MLDMANPETTVGRFRLGIATSSRLLLVRFRYLLAQLLNLRA